MPRACKVCSHPDREMIDKALVSNGNYRELSALYRVSEDSLLRHKSNHIPPALAKAQDAKEVAHADNIMGELQRCFERVNLLFDACDSWLRDPDDPNRYEIGPRAEDVSVIYSFQEIGPRGGLNTIRKKAKLSTLLKQINDHYGNNLIFELVETKHADPRELVLKAAERLQDQLELIARLLGELDQSPTANVLVTSPDWLRVRSAMLQALEPYPDARIAVSEALHAQPG